MQEWPFVVKNSGYPDCAGRAADGWNAPAGLAAIELRFGTKRSRRAVSDLCFASAEKPGRRGVADPRSRPQRFDHARGVLREPRRGMGSLDVELQAALNPDGDRKMERFGRTFASGGKVMRKRLRQGRLQRRHVVDAEFSEAAAEFDGRGVVQRFGGPDMPSPDVAIHRSQGSDYAAVVIPARHRVALQRDPLYAGAAGGKRLKALICESRRRGAERVRAPRRVEAPGVGGDRLIVRRPVFRPAPARRCREPLYLRLPPR